MVKSNASLFAGLADNNLYEAPFRRYIGHDERLHINHNVLMPCKAVTNRTFALRLSQQLDKALNSKNLKVRLLKQKCD